MDLRSLNLTKSIEELVTEPWRKNIKWDVTHQEAIIRTETQTFCFDPELSYETTGYRPITETKGLDFNPIPFKITGLTKQKEGVYHSFREGSRQEREFWLPEYDRSINGASINNYRITGDHYFFLNFYSMLVAKVGQRAGSGRDFTNPSFWTTHYEWFHYIELAEILGYDCAALKSRGVGFSEIGASLGVRPFITTPDYNAVYVAAYEPFLKGKGIIQKCWVQLDWLNLNTQGGMRRIRQGVNQDLHKRASKLNKENEEYGHMAQISGQVVDKSDKLRGDRTDRLVLEESGSNNVLLETYGVAAALVIPNGIRVGTRIVFGTGGDTEVGVSSKSKSGLYGLEKLFLDPRAFSILPYKHKYNNINQYIETAFFVPAWKTVIATMDNRGVVSEVKAKAYYTRERDKLRNQAEAYLKYCAEYCWTYEEALSRKGSNDFDQVKLANQRVEVEIKKTTPIPKRGHLSWTYQAGSNVISGVKFTEHPKGPVEIVEEPLERNELPIKDLYVAGIDSIDAGTSESIVGTEGSKFCIVIKKRTFGMQGNQYVAKYLDRPSDIREAYEKAAMLLTWYNCKANIEDTKVALKVYFREKGWIKLLMARPKYALEGQSSNTAATNLIGTQSSEKMIRYGLDLVRDHIVDYIHNMYFLDMIIQLQEYSYELKGKFDIVAAMQMCEIGDQDMMGISPKEEAQEIWDDIGYYTDSRGKKVYGIISKNNNNEFLFNNTPTTSPGISSR